MANALYDAARESFLKGEIDVSTLTIKAVLIDVADYTVNLATHNFLDDVPSGARVGTPQTLASKTTAAGVFDAADITFPALTGDPCEALIIYVHTGVDSTARLIAYLDTGTGLPVTPNGEDADVTWSSGSSRIFKL